LFLCEKKERSLFLEQIILSLEEKGKGEGGKVEMEWIE